MLCFETLFKHDESDLCNTKRQMCQESTKAFNFIDNGVKNSEYLRWIIEKIFKNWNCFIQPMWDNFNIGKP